MRARTLAVLLACVSASGCAEDPATEILLVVESRIEGADRVVVDVTHPDGESSSSEADLVARPGPRRLVLVHRGGALGPVALQVQALSGEAALATVSRVLAFEEGRTLRLEVVLAAACATRECGDETCGNGGRCRPSAVQPCELAVGGCLPASVDAGATDAASLDADTTDAGATDAGPSDGGPSDAGLDAGSCASFQLCGVEDVHLPGDRVSPRPCTGPVDGLVVQVQREGTPLPVSEGAAQVVRPGAHRARISNGTCGAERSFSVSGATAYDFEGTSGVLRDLAGRVDSAVLVGASGAYAIGEDSWVQVVGDGITSGIARDLSAVAYTSTGAWLGATGGATNYVFVPAPLGTGTPVAQPLTDPLRGATAMALPLGRETPVLYASSQGPAFLSSPTDPGSILDTRGVTWATMGSLAEAGRGAIWVGSSTSVWNLSTVGSGVAFGGAALMFEGAVRPVQTAALDESAGVTSLWVCGREVHRYDFVGDLSAASELPPPAVRVEEDCLDLAVGDDGQVWVARRLGGVLRLGRDGLEVLRYGVPQGLLGAPVFLSLDFASDTSGRALWLLSFPDRAVVRFRAGP